MSIKLIFKQAYQYFKSRSFLYFTFIPFLILVSSLIIGMFSFAYNYERTYKETLGTERVNFKLYLKRTFKPAWIGEAEGDNYYLIQEKINPQTGSGYFYDFLINLSLQSTPSNLLNQEEAQLLLLGLGYHYGEATELTMNEVLNNKLLKEHFNDLEENLSDYNRNAKQLAQKIYQKFQTNNLIVAYFLNFIQQNKGFLAHSFTEYWNASFIAPHQTQQIYWQHLIVKPSLIPEDPTFYEQTPWTLRSNPANTFQVQKQVNWRNYSRFLKERNFLYFSPKFLRDNNLKVGQIVRLNFNLELPDQPVPQINDNGHEFLIAGTMVNSNNYDYNKSIFFVPYQWITTYYEAHDLMPQNVRGVIYAHLPQFGNNWQRGQQCASQIFNERFTNLENPNEPLETETEWVDWLPGYIFKPAIVLFLVLAYFISILMIIFLVTVFYFITKQLIDYQAEMLMFLKALGTSNQQLSLLVTANLLIPFLTTIIGSFFGALLIQQITANLAFAGSSLYWNYFNFSFVFFIVWPLTILALTIIFYFVNLHIVNKQEVVRVKQPTIKGFTSTRKKLRIVATRNFSPKFKIGLAFVLKNLLQNFVTYLLLAITFSVILYTVQFKTSLEALSQIYERWNIPYKSINYNPQLYLYAPSDTNEFLRSYESRNDNNQLIPIDDFDQWNEKFNAYLVSVITNQFTFNWEQYYLTENFSLEFIKLIKDQTRFNAFIEELTKKLQKIWRNNPEKVQEIINIFLSMSREMETKADSLQQKFSYDNGFKIYFGQVPLIFNNRQVWIANSKIANSGDNIPLVAFRQTDIDSRYHFRFGEMLNDSDYLIPDGQEQSNLRINISSYLATKNNYHQGDQLMLSIYGLKNKNNDLRLDLPIYINKIIPDNNVTPEIYTSQEGLLYYLTQMPNLEPTTREIYSQLLNNLKTGTTIISNAVYDSDNLIPWGIRNITIPLYHHQAGNNGPPGTRLEDFYDPVYSQRYFASLGEEIMIFNQASLKALGTASQFIEILNVLIAIFAFLSVIICLILTDLFLAKNQRIITLLKSIGYQQNEIQWYLIFGYLLATIFALGTAIGLSVVIFNLTKRMLSADLGFNLYFLWSWQYIITAIGLGILFWLIIKVAISWFIEQQKVVMIVEEH